MTSGGRIRLASQACDGCRLRKVKCDMTCALSAPSFPGSFTTEGGGRVVCRRCKRLHLSCTFNIPSQPRGPRPKRRIRYDAQQQQQQQQLDRAAVSPTGPPGAGVSVVLGLDGGPRASSSSCGVMMAAGPSSARSAYPTDPLCARGLLKRMLWDYLRYVYPLIPIVHRPSFRRHVAQDHDLQDKDLLGLVVAICAVVVGLMPSRFEEYRRAEPVPLRFETRRAMINCCHDLIFSLRGPGYFDEISFNKFATSYLMAIATFQLGDQNKSRMLEVEAVQLGRLLHLHKISEYEGLNCIETQLRKKGFWLLFYIHVHSELQNLRREKLAFLDPMLLSSMNLGELLPLDVDDEQILEDSILPNPPPASLRAPAPACLTTGFIIHSRVFWAAFVAGANGGGGNQRNDTCQCQRARDRELNIAHLHARLEDLTYILDLIPPRLRQWAPATTALPPDAGGQGALESQFASMRANLHVTHLWLQSIIIDQLDAAEQHRTATATSITAGDEPSLHRRRQLWARREEICRQLLHVLHSIPGPDIEPNGLHLTFKVRDIAVGLFNRPYGGELNPASTRAEEYVRELSLILSQLDRSEKVNTANLQSWVDTDRIRAKGSGLLVHTRW